MLVLGRAWEFKFFKKLLNDDGADTAHLGSTLWVSKAPLWNLWLQYNPTWEVYPVTTFWPPSLHGHCLKRFSAQKCNFLASLYLVMLYQHVITAHVGMGWGGVGTAWESFLPKWGKHCSFIFGISLTYWAFLPTTSSKPREQTGYRVHFSLCLPLSPLHLLPINYQAWEKKGCSFISLTP